MDQDAGDVHRVPQSKMLPSLSPIGRFIDAVAEGDTIPRVPFAGSRPDDFRVFGVDGNIAEREGALPLEDGLPTHPAIGRLPQSSRGGSNVDDLRIARNALDIGHPTGKDRGPDTPPSEWIEGLRLLSQGGSRGAHKENQAQQHSDRTGRVTSRHG